MRCLPPVAAGLVLLLAGFASGQPYQVEQCKVNLVSPWGTKNGILQRPQGTELRIFKAPSRGYALSMSTNAFRISSDDDRIVLSMALSEGRKRIRAITDGTPVCVADIIVPANTATTTAERIVGSLKWVD